MVVHKSFVSMRPSDFPPEQWYKIVLMDPSEYRPIIIPRKGEYVAYKAYFINEYIKDKKIFDMVFPRNKFKRAIDALPRSLLKDLTRPVMMEFKYTKHRNVFIKQWEVL